MLGHGAIGQFAIGQAQTGEAAETITVSKWFEPLSSPVRFLPGLRASAQQFIALPGPYPFVPFAWFQELSKPAVLTKPGLRPALQQAFTLNALPQVSFAWYEGLSEPPRFKPGLRPALQQFFTTDTSVIPLHELIEWFQALSTPVRFRPMLLQALQQAFTGPSQLRPNPTTFGVLSGIETKDIFLAGAVDFNRVISGEVGVIEASFTGAQIGVSKVPAITSARVSISII